MVTPEEKRLRLLLRHINHVRDNCSAIAENLIENGEFDFAKQLLANAQIHDASKFHGVEWEHLNGWEDPLFEQAIRHHVTTNPHHPEYWSGGIHQMERLYIAEMAADWTARASELNGKGLVPWIEEDATRRFHFNSTDKIYKEIYEFIDLLLEPSFT